MNNSELDKITKSSDLEAIYTEMSVKVGKLQHLYLSAKDTLGIDHEITKALWNEYLKADEERHPFMVKMGQLQVREQMAYITEEEWSSIVD